MGVPITVVSIASPSESLAANQEWITEESEVITNPALKGLALDLQHHQQTFAVPKTTMAASSLQELTDLIEDGMGQMSKSISIHYTGDTSSIMADLKGIIERYLRKDDYINGTIANWQYGYKGYKGDVTVTININYLTTPTQEGFIQSEVERIVQEIIRPTMSEVEKVKAINDYIVYHSTYSKNTSTTPHSAYALLNEGKGVCQAYALLAYRMLKEAGMEVRYATGWAGEAHAWNLVKVDGQWYHLDTTWNDPVFATSSGDMTDYIRYKYFLISDREIGKDHRIDNFEYPSATSDRFVAMRGVASPIQLGTDLYYPNDDDDIKLYKLDLSKSPLQAEKVSNTRVKYLLYANDWLYFSNYSNGAYLYKMKPDGSGSTLLVNKKVTAIKRQKNELVAYSNNVEIYREMLQEDSNLQFVNQFIQQTNAIVLLSKQFKIQTEQVMALYNQLTSNERLFIPAEVYSKFTMVQEKYKKMQSLTFNDTVAHGNTRLIADSKKPWSIQLSQEVMNTPENLKQIELVNLFGEPVDVSIQAKDQTITVIPKGNYIEDIPYTLVIKPGLQNTDGDSLKQGEHLQFIYQVN